MRPIILTVSLLQGKGEEPLTGWEAQPDGAGLGSSPCVSVPGLSRGVESTCVKVTVVGGSGVLSHSDRATVIVGICYIFQNEQEERTWDVLTTKKRGNLKKKNSK